MEGQGPCQVLENYASATWGSLVSSHVHISSAAQRFGLGCRLLATMTILFAVQPQEFFK
jgi:hypothetical protein